MEPCDFQTCLSQQVATLVNTSKHLCRWLVRTLWVMVLLTSFHQMQMCSLWAVPHVVPQQEPRAQRPHSVTACTRHVIVQGAVWSSGSSFREVPASCSSLWPQHPVPGGLRESLLNPQMSELVTCTPHCLSIPKSARESSTL